MFVEQPLASPRSAKNLKGDPKKTTLTAHCKLQVRRVGETVYGTVTGLATALEFPISVLKVGEGQGGN